MLTASDRNAMLTANRLVFSGKIDYNTKALLDSVDIHESFWDQYGILQEYNDLSVMPFLVPSLTSSQNKVAGPLSVCFS